MGAPELIIAQPRRLLRCARCVTKTAYVCLGVGTCEVQCVGDDRMIGASLGWLTDKQCVCALCDGECVQACTLYVCAACVYNEVCMSQGDIKKTLLLVGL